MQSAVWSIIASIFTSVLVLVISKWWDPIARYLGYPFDVRRRVNDLVDKVQRLHEIKHDLRRLDPYPSSERCKGWVDDVQDLCHKAQAIKIGYDRCGLNYFKRCSLGEKANMELKKAIDLVGRGNELVKEAKGRPHPVLDVLPQHRQDQLWGMDSYKEKVRHFIQDNSTKSGLLGIWGMGGVGKTSLLKLVRDSSAEYAPCFDHVLFVQAGRGGGVGKMQKAVVAIMGLPVMPDEISQEGIIYNHLKDKNFILLIDDLWGYLDLKDVGIPMPLGRVRVVPVQEYRRKVVFTTRSKHVCGQMGCPNNSIRLECLSQDDAWKLFEDKVGKEIIKNTQLGILAREIVDECCGLPMALCTIGKAMSTKEDPKEWKSAINLLKESKLREITNTDEELFECLKFSYDEMAENWRNCFLMCPLWVKDKNIPKEKLIEWWVGLGFLDASNPSNEGYSIINCLVNASMLEKGDNGLDSTENSHVKMHRMIRNMALWIANDRGHQNIWLPHSDHRVAFPEEEWCKVERAWISSTDTSRWSSSIRCPHLLMLVARPPFLLQFVPNFEEITFLDLEGANIGEFPLVICGLDKLQYLNLSASKFDGLPLELTELSNLKYLHIRGIGSLQKIPKGLISKLKKLQLLDLFCSGTMSDKVQFLPSLMEQLASKTIYLLYFGITVHTGADIKELGCLSSVRTQALCMDRFEDESHLNKIDLELLSCLENMQELTITRSSVNELELEPKEHTDYDEYGLLPDIEFLELRHLSKLQEVTWKNSGLNIRVVVIGSCAKLRHATWVQQLQSLQELTISDCPKLEQVIDDAEANQRAGIFRQLRKLKLEQLPELFHISEQGFPFEELSYVRVDKCEKLMFIKIQRRINQQKIRIDCNRDWWTSSVENKEIANPLFVPTFCL
ncbi:unnamed protein product [Urochloa decumbens]|uniref:NB-ARC domain-containing protein n=1 Tax=Urochloa decumbens TaxID=240449 RepID=A0ABC9H1U1_9POAL